MLNVKVILHESGNNLNGEFESIEDYYLAPKEQRTIKLTLEGKLDESKRINMFRKNFEVILWNDKEQVRFLSE